jgi:hypothetical protein
MSRARTWKKNQENSRDHHSSTYEASGGVANRDVGVEG